MALSSAECHSAICCCHILTSAVWPICVDAVLISRPTGTSVLRLKESGMQSSSRGRASSAGARSSRERGQCQEMWCASALTLDSPGLAAVPAVPLPVHEAPGKEQAQDFESGARVICGIRLGSVPEVQHVLHIRLPWSKSESQRR